jgi:hypothetical protein
MEKLSAKVFLQLARMNGDDLKEVTPEEYENYWRQKIDESRHYKNLLTEVGLYYIIKRHFKKEQ